MNALRTLFCLGSSLAVSLLVACGSPLVGLECKSGYTRCGDGCYDLRSDEAHCGSCDLVCASGEQCSESMCLPGGPDAGDGGDAGGMDAGLDASLDGGDGAAGDGSLGDGGDLDARSDARPGDGQVGDAAGNDGGGGGDGSVTLPALCTGPGSPADCVCGLGQIKCDNECVDPSTDRENCGGCDIACAAEEYCAAGICAPICEPPLTLCAPICVYLQENDAHCGMCNHACGAGAACIEGQCVGRAVGHIVLMGHDMSGVRPPMRTMVSNAVFLVRGSPVRVLVYDEATNPAARTGVSGAIQAGSIALSRSYTTASASAELVSAQLSSADVFVIETQHTATNERLRELGASWSAALDTFLFRGGVILVLDAGGSNDGTHLILEGAGLFNVNARVGIPRGLLDLETASDAIAAGVPTEYQSEGETAGFDVDLVANPATVVIRDPNSMLPVVLHKTVVD